jgi:hypothetical protein
MLRQATGGFVPTRRTPSTTRTWGLCMSILKVHMAPDLWMKVNEEYNSYPPVAKGEPLFLYLMIHHLMAMNQLLPLSPARSTVSRF